MNIYTVLIIVLAIIAPFVVGFVFRKQIADFLFRMMSDSAKQLIDEREKLFDEKLKGNEKFVEGKKDLIKELVEQISLQLKSTKEDISKVEKERITQFEALSEQLKSQNDITKDLQSSTDNLKNLLSNNQLRGKWGEEVAENLLKSVGFVKGQNYLVNLKQDTKASRPDFTILLPDKTKVNIDIKFPYKALLRYQEATTEGDKAIALKEFEKDVKQKIKEVSTRDYINPEEKTVDFVVLFIPNEMIFSFVYEKLNNVWDDALQKKVIMAGPFSFTAILRMIHQSYQSFKYQENLYEIIKLIKVFDEEYQKFNEALDTLGTRLASTSKQFDTVAVTRTKKLSSVIEKIKMEEEEVKALDSGKAIEE